MARDSAKRFQNWRGGNAALNNLVFNHAHTSHRKSSFARILLTHLFLL
jgi:hypothetical protein